MVGADALSHLAKESEAAVQNKDIAYVREHHKELLAKYHEVVRQISEALGRGENTAEQSYSETRKEISCDELLAKLMELKEWLAAFEIDKAEVVISQISESEYQGTSVKELLREIRGDVEDFEFSEAGRKVEELLERMKGGEL